MPQYVTGMGRIVLNYTMDFLEHKFRVFCKQPAYTGSDLMIYNWITGVKDIKWTEAADDLAQTLASVLATGATFQAAFLEKWTGVAWQTMEFHTVTPSTPSGFTGPGWQFTYVLRDTSFDKFKIVVMEPKDVSLNHWEFQGGGPGAYDSFTQEFGSGYLSLRPPYKWATSHRELFVHASAGFVGATLGTNRKLRRARSLA